MPNINSKAIAASLRVIGDELLTIAGAIDPPPQVQAEQTAQPVSAQQVFDQAAPVPTQQSAPVQQAYVPPQQQAAPVQQQQQQQQAAPPPVQQTQTDDGFREFSSQLVALGRMAGPLGLGPIMQTLMPKYAPGAQGIAQIPPPARQPFLAEVQAYVTQQGAAQ